MKQKRKRGPRNPVRVPTLEEVQDLCSSIGLDEADAQGWKRKWLDLRGSAPAREAKCLLTLKQYLKLAVRAELQSPSMVGRHKGKHHMSRKGDTGDYVWGNCRFLTVEENLNEKRVNGGYLVGGAKAAEKLRGRSKETDKGVAEQARKITGRTKKNHPGRLVQSIKLSKKFLVVSPGGRRYRGRNLKEFCLSHDLNPGGMSGVCRSLKPSHKGWTGYYL